MKYLAPLLWITLAVYGSVEAFGRTHQPQTNATGVEAGAGANATGGEAAADVNATGGEAAAAAAAVAAAPADTGLRKTLPSSPKEKARAAEAAAAADGGKKKDEKPEDPKCELDKAKAHKCQRTEEGGAVPPPAKEDATKDGPPAAGGAAAVQRSAGQKNATGTADLPHAEKKESDDEGAARNATGPPPPPEKTAPAGNGTDDELAHGLPETTFPKNQSQPAADSSRPTAPAKAPAEVDDLNDSKHKYLGQDDVDDEKHVKEKMKAAAASDGGKKKEDRTAVKKKKDEEEDKTPPANGEKGRPDGGEEEEERDTNRSRAEEAEGPAQNNVAMLQHDAAASPEKEAADGGSISMLNAVGYTLASLLLIAAAGYAFLMLFSKRIHTWRYGNRQVLINEEEFNEESSDSHQFEMGRQDDINGEL